MCCYALETSQFVLYCSDSPLFKMSLFKGSDSGSHSGNFCYCSFLPKQLPDKPDNCTSMKLKWQNLLAWPGWTAWERNTGAWTLSVYVSKAQQQRKRTCAQKWSSWCVRGFTWFLSLPFLCQIKPVQKFCCFLSVAMWSSDQHPIADLVLALGSRGRVEKSSSMTSESVFFKFGMQYIYSWVDGVG